MKTAFFALFLLSGIAHAAPASLKCTTNVRNPGPGDFKSLSLQLIGNQAQLKFDGAKNQVDNSLDPSGEQAVLRAEESGDAEWLVFRGDENFGQDDAARQFGLTMKRDDLASGARFTAHLSFTKPGVDSAEDFSYDISCSR